MRDLTPRQKKFCILYAGGMKGCDAYIGAGYKVSLQTARVNASKLLTKANIREYLEELAIENARPSIADMVEVQEFWSTIMRKKEWTDTKDRLRASELIAKANGAFIEKIEVSGTVQVVFNGEKDLED